MRNIRFHSILILFLAVGCCFTACKKDEASAGKKISLVIGDFNPESGQKLYLNEQNLPVWNDPDTILLHDGTAAAKAFVHRAAEENKFEVTVDESKNDFYAVYPFSGSEVNTEGGSVSVPALQDYREDAEGHQLLKTPMAACLHGNGGSLFFRNLASVIKVDVRNFSLENDLTVYTVSATAHDQYLCGTLDFTFTPGVSTSSTQDVATCGLNETGRGKTVSLFCGIEGIRIAKGASKSFYLVVAPYTVADSLVFTVNGASDASYARFQLRQNTARTLGRNRIGTQVFASSFDHGVPSGVFSTSPTTKVEIAPGNLQYQASTETWRFAPQQYSKIGWNEGNGTDLINCPNKGRATQSRWIDLFCWGATGCDNKYPPYTAHEDVVPKTVKQTLTISNTDYDWGYYCNIYNPRSGNTNPKGTWRLPRGKRGTDNNSSEYYYMLNTRDNTTLGNVQNARYAFIKIDNDKFGAVIFPDNYIHPSSVAVPNGINSYLNSHNCSAYSESQWKLMELAGCAFFPSCGYASWGLSGEDDGYYMTADCEKSNYAPYEMQFVNSFSGNVSGSAVSQKSVRLFRDVK